VYIGFDTWTILVHIYHRIDTLQAANATSAYVFSLFFKGPLRMLCVCVSSVSYYIWSVCLYYGEGRSKVRLGVTKKLKNKN